MGNEIGIQHYFPFKGLAYCSSYLFKTPSYFSLHWNATFIRNFILICFEPTSALYFILWEKTIIWIIVAP